MKDEIDPDLKKWIEWLSERFVSIDEVEICGVKGYMIVLRVQNEMRGVLVNNNKTEVYEMEPAND